jgi:hypothetical protein
MEANQITCPQCGLANNELADACVQCGIIFVKNPAMQAQTMPDEQKRKAIEEAEAMLDETQTPPEIDAFRNEIIKRPDPGEDTVEMQIPKEETTDIKPEISAPQEPKAAENKNSGNHEIELEAIEAAVETVNEPADVEALFLSGVNTGKPAESKAPEMAGAPAGPENANDQSGETGKSDANPKDSQDQKAEALPVKPPPGGNPMTEPQKEENRVEKEPEETKSEGAEPAKTEAAAAEAVEPAKSADNSTFKNTTQPAEKEIQLEEKPELTMTEEAPAQTEPQTHANATVEMPKELAEEQAQADQQTEKAKQDALKKQQEAQAKAEALKNEKAAQTQAVALKKKKLVRAKVAALKKQKAALAKVEALKKKKEALAKAQASKKQEAARAKADALNKQKEAQVKAEASSQEMQVASTGRPQAAAESTNHHERLLGLLKRYKGKAIGINYDNSSEIREAELVDANEEFFSVMVKDKKLQYSYPLKTIVTIIEGQEGVETGEDDKKAKFDAVIKVYPLVLF